MAPWLRALIAPTEDLDLVPSIHLRQLTAAHNSSSKKGPLFLVSVCIPANAQAYTHMHINKNEKLKIKLQAAFC